MRIKVGIPGRVTRFWALIKENLLLFVSIVLILLSLGINQVSETAAHILLTAYCVSVLCFVIWQMIEKTRFGNFRINLLLVVAVITALVQKQYWTAALVLAASIFGELVFKLGEYQTNHQLRIISRSVPHQATVIRGRKTEEIKVSQVKNGDKLLVRTGELVPVDCIIIEGSTKVNDHVITGNKNQHPVSLGSVLLAGSLNTGKDVSVRALQTQENSLFEKLLRIVKTSSHSKSEFVSRAETFVIPFTILSFIIAGGMWLWSGSSERFLQVLVVATPSGLLLGAVLGIRNSLDRMAGLGIFIKSGKAFENLASLRTLAFDKSLIMSSEGPKITSTTSLSKYFNKSQILGLAASLNQKAATSLSQAVVTAASEKNVRIIKARGVSIDSGTGISGYIGRLHVIYGNEQYIKKQDIKIPKTGDLPKGSVNYIAVDGQLIGAIAYEQELSQDAKAFIDAIHDSSAPESLLISDDSQKTANEMAASHGISAVLTETAASAKLNYIENIPKNSRPLGYIGDSASDPLVLSVADVGIAINYAQIEKTSDSAKVLIIENDILKAARCAGLAGKMLKRVQISVLTGILLSLALMGIFSTGKVPAIYGPAAIVAADIAVAAIAVPSLSKIRKARLTNQ